MLQEDKLTAYNYAMSVLEKSEDWKNMSRKDKRKHKRSIKKKFNID